MKLREPISEIENSKLLILPLLKILALDVTVTRRKLRNIDFFSRI